MCRRKKNAQPRYEGGTILTLKCCLLFSINLCFFAFVFTDKHIEKLFNIVDHSIKTPTTAIKDLNSIGTAINTFTKSLNSQRFVDLFKIIKSTMDQIECNIKTLRVDQTVCNEFRNVLRQHMTNKKTQELVKCNKDPVVHSHLVHLIKKSDDEFVFIPTDWQLKPNKLTEHQTEKMKQRKSDIPALYNDLSQSQDSISIKEWSAKKPESSLSAHITEVISDIKATINCTNSENSIAAKTLKKTKSEAEILAKKRENELKKLQIDAVFPTVAESEENQKNTSRSRRSTATHKRYTDAQDSDKTDDNKSSKQKRNRSSANKSNVKNASDKDNSIEVIESSQALESQSIISRRGRKSMSRQRTKNVLSEKQQCATVRNPTNETIAQMDTMLNTDIDCTSDVISNCNIAEMDTEINSCELGKAVSNTSIEFSDETVVSVLSKPKQIVSSNEKVSTKTKPDVQPAAEPLCQLNVVQTSERQSPIQPIELDTVKKLAHDISTELSIQPANLSKENYTLEHVVDIYNQCTQPLSQSSNAAIVETSDNQTRVESVRLDTVKEPEKSLSVEQNSENNVAKVTEIVDGIENENHIEAPMSPLLPKSNDTANQSILSSLNCSDIEDRNNELINNTMDISPIFEAKQTIEPNPTVVESPATLLIKKALVCDVDSPTRKKLESVMVKVAIESPKARLTSTPMQSPCSSRVQFRGRAAQMLNLANIKRDNSPTPKRIRLSAAPTEAKTGAQDPNQRVSSPELTYEDLLARNKDLLTFSKELPSPDARAGFSILKRKYDPDDTFDDNDLQANKRKRVSFHDPPVSATKEFLRHVDENPPLRSGKDAIINLDECSQRMLIGSNILRRKSRADSMVEIAKFSNANKLLRTANETQPSRSMSPLQMGSLNYDSTDDTVGLLENDKIDDAMTVDQDISITPSPMITFADKSDILQYVFEEYTFSQLFTKYTESERVIGPELKKLLQNEDISRPLIRELSNVMADNAKLKSNVFEQLGDKHATEFLNHAVQENRSSDVLKRLTIDSVVEYACEMLKTNENVTPLLIRGLSSVMTENPQIESSVLEQLADKHATILLDHAVQTNGSTDILKRLTIDTVVDYVCEMVKTNDNVKEILMRDLSNVMTENVTIKSNILEHLAKKYGTESLNHAMQHNKSSDILDYVCKMVHTNDTVRQTLIEKLLLDVNVKQTILQQVCNAIEQPGNSNHLPKAFSAFVLGVFGQQPKM